MSAEDRPEAEAMSIEIQARSSGRRLSFRLMGDPTSPRTLGGFAAWVTFWYPDATESHVVRAASVDEGQGLVIYELNGDECPRPGMVFAQPTVMSAEQGFFEHSGEVVAIKVLPAASPGDRHAHHPPSASVSGLRTHDRFDLVMPPACKIELDISTGQSKVLSPPPGVAGTYSFFERSDPGQAWNDLFRAIANRLALPQDTGTFLAMMTVFGQKAWERVPCKDHQRYVAGSIRAETRRSQQREEIEERELRTKEPLWDDLAASSEGVNPIEEALPHDPQAEIDVAEDWAARIERCRKVLAGIDGWSKRQDQLRAGLERQVATDEPVSPSEVGRSLGWSHEETMSAWQSLQRKAQRALRQQSEEGGEF